MITEPEQISRWFSDETEVEGRAGADGTLTWRPGGRGVDTGEPSVATTVGLAHPGDDLLDGRRVSRVAHPFLQDDRPAWKPGSVAGETTPPSGIESSETVMGPLLWIEQQTVLGCPAGHPATSCLHPPVGVLLRRALPLDP